MATAGEQGAEEPLGLELPPLSAPALMKEGCYVVLEQQNDKTSLLVVKRGGCGAPHRRRAQSKCCWLSRGTVL